MTAGAVHADVPAAVPPAGARRVRKFVKRVGLPLGLRLGSFTQYPPRPLRLPAPLPPRPGVRPKVSIVTPSFNQASFLPRTIESVLAQGYPALEYRVHDGASTDGSAQVLERFRGRLSGCVSEPDGGQTDAINRGFALCDGDVLAWLNSDDLLLPGAVEAAARAFEDNPEVDVVYGHRLVIDEEGMEVGRWVLPPHRPRALLWRDYIPQETMFWRRRIWEKVGSSLDASFRFAMDWDLVLRFHRAGARFRRLDRFLGAFRTHPAQKSLAWVDEVGWPEFEKLHRTHIPPGLPTLRAKLGSAAHLLSSVACFWGERAGLLGRG